MYEPTTEELISIDRDAQRYKSNRIKQLQYKEDAIQKRLDKGLKLNRITSHEIQLLLEDWLEQGRSNLKKSALKVYEQSDKVHKEVDWVDAILASTHYAKELLTAFDKSINGCVIILKSSKLFSTDTLSEKATLSKRIRKMDLILKYENELIEKEKENEELRRQLAVANSVKSWEDRATILLEQGLTQKEVADQVGKGINTIGRLVKRLKEEKENG